MARAETVALMAAAAAKVAVEEAVATAVASRHSRLTWPTVVGDSARSANFR